MAIANVLEKAGKHIWLYDEKGKVIKTICISSGKLIGFTSTTVSVQYGSQIWIYNEKGVKVGTSYAK